MVRAVSRVALKVAPVVESIEVAVQFDRGKVADKAIKTVGVRSQNKCFILLMLEWGTRELIAFCFSAWVLRLAPSVFQCPFLALADAAWVLW